MATIAATHKPTIGKIGDTLLNFWLDIALFIAFVVDMNTRFTGLAIHEWLGIGFGVALVYHLLLHWNWIATCTRKIISRLPGIQRLRYFLDLLLFIDIVTLVATGIFISEVALRQIGLSFASNPTWRVLHELTAEWAIWLVGLHIALDWKWFVSTFKRYFIRPFRRSTARS